MRIICQDFHQADAGSSSTVESPATTMVTGTLGEPTEDEHGNLMWLVDFKLDLLTDIDKETPGEENNNEINQPEKKKAKFGHEPPPAHVAETRSRKFIKERLKKTIFDNTPQSAVAVAAVFIQ